MGKFQKFTHEELQKDEVAESLQEMFNWLQANRIRLIWIGILALAGVAAFFTWQSRKNRILDESNALMGKAITDYTMLTMQSDPQTRAKTVEDTLADLDNLVERYPSTRLADEAIYLRGMTLYTVGRFSEAQEAYQQYIDRAKTDMERARGEIALGYAFENESFFLSDKTAQVEKLKAAQSHYELALQRAEAKSYLYYYALMSEARIYELTGDNAKARELYERIANERPAPLMQAEEAEAQHATKDRMTRMLLDQLRQMEGELSFAATAKLRLERLGAIAAETPKASAEGAATASAATRTTETKTAAPASSAAPTSPTQ